MRYLHVGGVVAMGFDPSGQYLLTISHSGRGVFSTRTWERVARDTALASPDAGVGVGIGPIADLTIRVTEKDYETEELSLTSPDGRISVEYDSGTITVSGEGT